MMRFELPTSEPSMARVTYAVCLHLLLFPLCSISQDNEEPWLSLSRLSLTASASYHYSPWKKYNESLVLAQEAIRYGPSYPNPQGGLEKIHGDGSFRVTAGYRIVSGFSLSIGAGFMRTGSNITLSYNPSLLIYPGGYSAAGPTRTTEQKIVLSVPEYGIGLQYTRDLGELFALSALASIYRAFGSVRFEHSYEYYVWKYLFSAELRQRSVGMTLGAEVVLRAFGPLRIVSSIDYRWLKFPNLRGSGTYVYRETQALWTYEDSRAFEAQLGEADGYFGLLVTRYDQPVADYLLHNLWVSAPVQPWWKTQQRAVLDLSGFGISLGVRYAF